MNTVSKNKFSVGSQSIKGMYYFAKTIQQVFAFDSWSTIKILIV